MHPRNAIRFRSLPVPLDSGFGCTWGISYTHSIRFLSSYTGAFLNLHYLTARTQRNELISRLYHKQVVWLYSEKLPQAPVRTRLGSAHQRMSSSERKGAKHMVQDVIERRVVTYPALPTGMTDQQFVDLWLRRYKASSRETYKSAAYRFLFFLEEKRRSWVRSPSICCSTSRRA